MSTEITQFENLRSIEPPNGQVFLMSGNQSGEPAMNNLDSITADQLRTSPRGYKVRSPWMRNLLTFLMVFGPGLIVMEADNDAGAVSTYTQAGGQYGLRLLWVMLLLLPVCYFIQEMVVRLGIATGRGHAAMIYERFGKWWGRFSLFDLLLVNFLTLVTEFAAISLATQQMGISPNLSVPIAAVALIIHVTSGSYRRWERITCVLCLLDLTWVVMAIFCHPHVGAIVRSTVIPSVPGGGITVSLVFLVIAIVGTTIAPWQLFFQQSCVADKRLRFADLRWARLDTFIGACFTVIVGGAMMIVGSVSYRHGLNYEDPAKMADAIRPFFHNDFVRNGVLIMFCNAAVLGTTAISLSSAWAFSEVSGWKHGLDTKFKEAPGFYTTYALCTLAAASLVLDWFLVVHPLDDHPEEKLKSDHLAPLEMTPAVRLSLFALRAYLILRRGFEQKETKVWVSILSGASTAASATLELLASRFL